MRNLFLATLFAYCVLPSAAQLHDTAAAPLQHALLLNRPFRQPGVNQSVYHLSLNRELKMHKLNLGKNYPQYFDITGFRDYPDHYRQRTIIDNMQLYRMLEGEFFIRIYNPTNFQYFKLY